MKIKEVCETTGLTDKAIRFYISNNLINPKYTENYAGRKNYSFNDDDVDTLKKIALLRSFDFSVSDIKNMLTNEKSAKKILEDHIFQIKSSTKQSSEILNSLLNASVLNIKSTNDLCNALEEQQSVKELPKNSNNDEFEKYIKKCLKKVKNNIPKLIFIAFSAIILTVIVVGLFIFLITKVLINLEVI